MVTEVSHSLQRILNYMKFIKVEIDYIRCIYTNVDSKDKKAFLDNLAKLNISFSQFNRYFFEKTGWSGFETIKNNLNQDKVSSIQNIVDSCLNLDDETVLELEKSITEIYQKAKLNIV